MAPRVVWNATSSVDVGFYWISQRSPATGDIAAVRLPAAVAEFAHARGYLPRTALLLKPVAAVGGDRVCRWGKYILIDGRLCAVAVDRDRTGRPLPAWRGCRMLQAGDVFVLSPKPGSFDSRYFGVLTRDDTVGRAALLWDRNERGFCRLERRDQRSLPLSLAATCRRTNRRCCRPRTTPPRSVLTPQAKNSTPDP